MWFLGRTFCCSTLKKIKTKKKPLDLVIKMFTYRNKWQSWDKLRNNCLQGTSYTVPDFLLNETQITLKRTKNKWQNSKRNNLENESTMYLL